MTTHISPSGKIKIKRQDGTNLELHLSEIATLKEIANQGEATFRSHVYKESSALVSPLDLSSKIEIHYSNTYQNELYSCRIASQKVALGEYERMILTFNIKNTQLAEDLKVLRHSRERNEYLDEKIQELRSEGISVKDLFQQRALAQESRIFELETEVALHKDRIAEAEGETQQQAQLYHWEAEQHKMSLRTLEGLQSQAKLKATYVAKLEESLEERMNLEMILENDRGLKALATKLGLVKSKERKLDSLNSQVESFLRFERDDSRKRIQELERENASLRHDSSAAAYHQDKQLPIHPERVTELEAKNIAIEEELTETKIFCIKREQRDARIIQKLEEQFNIFKRFRGGCSGADHHELAKHIQEATIYIGRLETQLQQATSIITESEATATASQAETEASRGRLFAAELTLNSLHGYENVMR